MEPNKYADFQNWFNRKWAEWDIFTGRRSTQQELADHLNIKRTAVAQYTSGRQVPEGENLRNIAGKFGLEAYDKAGVQRPERSPLDDLPPAFREKLLRASDKLYRHLRDNSIPENSPEAEKIAREIFSKEFTLIERE
jgi:transcriptional regulator with XRE-family HTH domain